MARYRKVDPRIWNDAKFRKLSDNGKLVFLFVLTHPHMTSLGAMRATLPGLAAELSWTAKAFREAFQEAFRQGLIEHDEEAAFVGLPNFLRYNPPESPNVVKSWREQWPVIPECDLKVKLYHRVKAFTEGLGKGFAEGYLASVPAPDEHPSPNPEPEPEPELEHEYVRARFQPPSVEEVTAYCAERKNGIDPQRFIDYHEARGWKLGKATMKDWKATVRTWEKNQKDTEPKDQQTQINYLN